MTFPSSIPEAREARWRLLETIIARWFPAQSSSAGSAESELRDAERRFGCRFPEALREWYASFGARSDVWCVQDRLLPPANLRVENGFVLFAEENQTCWYWGISKEEFQSSDPAVFISTAGSAKRWERESDSLSRFALQYAMLNVKFGGGTAWTANGPLTPTARASIEAGYALLPFGELHAPVFPTRFFGDAEIVLEVEGEAWLWATAQDERSLNRLDSLLRGLEWEQFGNR